MPKDHQTLLGGSQMRQIFTTNRLPFKALILTR